MSGESNNNDYKDWVERLTKLAGSLGFNEVRVRWKLEGFRNRAKAARFRAGEQTEHIRYKHKICESCGRLNDGEAKECVKCGAPLAGQRWHMLQRLGLSLPAILSISSLLGTAMVIIYGRLLLAAEPGDGIWSFSVTTLFRFGGNWAPAVLAGHEYWRLVTSIFLHAGLWHIGFNLLALSMLGPTIEELFGRGRMLFFFMLTGVIASLGSALSGSIWSLVVTGTFAMAGGGVSIGASGAILGLIGIGAGWGQRDGTTLGKQTRNKMLLWCVYTLIFGFFIGADNVAHIVGFISGGLIGLLVPPNTLARRPRVPLIVTQAIVGAGFALTGIVLCLLPPRSPGQSLLDRRLELARGERTMERETAELCRRFEESSDLDFAWHEMPAIPIIGHTEGQRRATLESLCESQRYSNELCQRYVEGGLERVFADQPQMLTIVDYSPERRRSFDRIYTERCGAPAVELRDTRGVAPREADLDGAVEAAPSDGGVDGALQDGGS